MKTKEEFLQEAYGYKFEEEDFINPAIIITLNAMEKYAQQQVKNLNIPYVSNNEVSLLDCCRSYIRSRHLSVDFDNFMKNYIKQ